MFLLLRHNWYSNKTSLATLNELIFLVRVVMFKKIGGSGVQAPPKILGCRYISPVYMSRVSGFYARDS